jgi:hypothetical protein
VEIHATKPGGRMKITVSVEISDSDSAGENIVVAEIDRRGPVNAASLGLTLAEAKGLLRKIQTGLVEAQLANHLEVERTCRICGKRRWVKENRPVCFKSLFGGIKLAIPRLKGCSCACSTSGTKTLTIEGMANWVAPELEYVQSRLAAGLPYARASELLTLLLPVNAGNSTSALRRRTLAVGQRLDTQLREDAVVPDAPNRMNSLVSMGLDSGFVRDCQPRSERSFEVVVGRILGQGASSRSLGFVRKMENNEQVRHRIRCRVTQEGANTDTLTVFSDGDASMRCLQLDVLPNAVHVLDWYHLTRHLTVLKRVLNGQEALAEIPDHHHQTLRFGLKSLKWRLWHGQYWRAIRKLKQFLFTLRLRTVSSKPVARRLRRLATKLMKLLSDNTNSLPNYGKRYRAGERIATSFVESAVNQLIDKRMSKSQQMRWSHAGAHLLLQVRAEAVDRRLAKAFKQWYPGFHCGELSVEAA